MSRYIILVIVMAVSAMICCSSSSSGGAVTVGTPTNGTFGTSLPTDSNQKPYIDYTVKIGAAGNYQIDLVSKNTSNYDPYITLRQGSNDIASDDDGGGELQSRLTKELQPGDYTIRVTRFGGGQLDTATDFTLTVTKQGG